MVKKISNEQILKDLEITQRESFAYRNISEGFERLYLLHEKDGGAYPKFCRGEHLKYYKKYNECNRLIEELIRIKTERGL